MSDQCLFICVDLYYLFMTVFSSTVFPEESARYAGLEALIQILLGCWLLVCWKEHYRTITRSWAQLEAHMWVKTMDEHEP